MKRRLFIALAAFGIYRSTPPLLCQECDTPTSLFNKIKFGGQLFSICDRCFNRRCPQ